MYCGNKSFFCSPKLGYANMRRNINKSESTQTDQWSQLDLLKFLLFSENFITNENSSNVYNLLLNYINSFHHVLNEKITNYLMENGTYNIFKIPDIPNYLMLYNIVCSKKDTKTNRTRDEQLTLQDLKSKGSYSVNVSLNSQISHKVIKEKLELQYSDNEQHSNLGMLKTNMEEELREFTNSTNTEHDYVNGSHYGDDYIIFSKYEDAVCIKTNVTKLTDKQEPNSQHLENKISITGITESSNDNFEERRNSVSSVFNEIDNNYSPKDALNDSEDCSDCSVFNYLQHGLGTDDRTRLLNVNKCKKLRPDSSTKVLEMFDKISSRNLFANETVAFEDLKYSSEKKSTIPANSDALSESGSEILDDDEFELMTHACSIKTDSLLFQNNASENVSDISQEKSHPLQLSEKDLSNLNKKMINAIGLFTDNGDIKPTVLNILERQRNSRPDDKTQQFRSKRPFVDL